MMSRLPILPRDALPAASAPLLEAVEKTLGIVPNLFLVAGLSPAALGGLLGLNGALGGVLDARLRESIAIAVAHANDCDYCLSAHTSLGGQAGLDGAELAANRAGRSADARTAAALAFARQIVATRGRVGEGDLAEVRSAGFGDAEIVEIVALVALNILTNYLNNVAETDIDFPLVRAERAAA